MLRLHRVGLCAGTVGAAAVLTLPAAAAGVSAGTLTGAVSATAIGHAIHDAVASSLTASHHATSTMASRTQAGITHPVTHASRTGGTGSIACNDGTVTWSPTTIWPPNHSMHTVTISYSDTDNDGDTTMLTVDSITDNDMVNGSEINGTGQPSAQQGPDWTGEGNMASGSDPNQDATTTVTVRAERSGHDTSGGRVYDIKVTCTDTGGADTNNGMNPPKMQTVDLSVTVPHDQGNG